MIKGILFDKDGTLIDFSLWRDAAKNTVNKIMAEYKTEDQNLYDSLIRSIGIVGDNVDPFGALAYKTHEEVARELHFVLKKNNIILEYPAFKSYVEETLRREVLREDVEF
jgi:phosphoglycolate phosphatase-like HAD superfamily hydrolase